MMKYNGAFVAFVLLLVYLIQLHQVIYAQPLAQGKQKFMGCGITNPIPASFNSYWNQVSPGNEGKWGSVESGQDNYSWEPLDQIYNYAIQHGMLYKHHTLIWGQQQPGWISSLDSASQYEEIEEWIRLVGERYPLMDCIDVVNEPLPTHNPPDGGGTPARANYKRALGGNGTTGYDWVIKSFELARKYCAPKVKLILNDYGIINDNSATSQYLTVINLLKARNLIDGIGVQGHRFELMNKDTANLRYNLDRLAATGLPVYISEFDLGVDNNSTYNPTIQLSEYRRIFPVLWNHPGVKGITFWGYIQGQMWQVNTFILYADGSETPSFTWLRNYLTTGNYRSHQNGNWNDMNTWEKHNGTNWIFPAPTSPVILDEAITIRNGHTVMVTVNDSIDQVSVLEGGTLVVNSGIRFLIKGGGNNDLLIAGTVRNSGIMTKDASANIHITSTGKYVHDQDGGEMPTVEWGVGSTYVLSGIVSNIPANFDQDYFNFTWNCPGQNSNLSLGWQDGKKVKGTLTVTSTNWNHESISSPANQLRLFNGSGNCTIGNIVVNGSNAILTAQGSDYADTVTVTGNVTLSNGGMLSLSNSSGGETTFFIKGNFAVLDSAYLGKSSSSNTSKIVFNNTGIQNLSIPITGLNIFGAPNITVSEGSVLNMDSSVFGGTGSFRVESGGSLQTAHVSGINGNIQCSGENGGGNSFSDKASYIYNGVVPQVTGNLLPPTVADLTINNKSGVILTNSIVVNGTLDLITDKIKYDGGLLSFGTEGTLKFSGSAPQTSTDTTFPAIGGPRNLTINNRFNVTLHASREIMGSINFLMGKLNIGANTLIASITSNASVLRHVITTSGGILKLKAIGTEQVLFPVGTNTYAPVWITNTGVVDDIAVSVLAETTPAPYGGRVTQKWSITEATSGGGDYELQFGWMGSAEDASFKSNRTNNARLYLLPDTIEAGTGTYTTQFSNVPYTLSRSGISSLGTFVVGGFKLSTDIEDRQSEIPRYFELSQNYPNPFNPTTQIKYSVPKQSYLSIKVYNLLGQEVMTLFEGVKESGSYVVSLNADRLSSGIYLYRLQSQSTAITKKFVLMK